MNSKEIIHQARLEGVYGIMRSLQSVHNSFETPCVGTSGCCKVGLFLSLGECWNIAKELRRDYWKLAENTSIDNADSTWQEAIDALVNELQDEEWTPEIQERSAYCVFYDKGCTIYEYRPMVCRSYGVISPVQEGVCGRKRLPDGGHELIRDGSVDRVLSEFDSLIAQWGIDWPELNYSMYMPAGVLKFLLSTEELQELITTTDKRFWMGSVGYKHSLAQENWGSETPITLRRKSV